ncbi:hypothetical protein [Flavisolibacter ginsenosidimutans]|uniref:Chemotaxis methyl-accepting receptor HlyB-like 4HB MCP domain-containing protein n=1 Tax=Flavisolibacter ginsenosidimutans TaxID=661481 RepID=A0A5B8UKE2_9BACT|nr:hypothetical protein [Flavisolibacter ginsenosidimutans]QEC56906.1 hypothetical protein FSB75_13700 [Flavisolibacter ginsenosidimutans]
MATGAQKTIAKEIILLTSLLLISILFFLGNLCYNLFQKRNVLKYERQSILIVKTVDSLHKAAAPMLDSNNLYKFFKTNNLTEKDERTFLKVYSNPDSAKLIHEFMLENKLTTLNETTFYQKYLLKKNVSNYLSLKEQFDTVYEKYAVLREKQSDIQKKILTNTDIRQNLLWFLSILFAIFYFVRPLMKGLKWSFRILHD